MNTIAHIISHNGNECYVVVVADAATRILVCDCVRGVAFEVSVGASEEMLQSEYYYWGPAGGCEVCDIGEADP